MTIETITAFLYVWLTISLAFPVLAIWLIMRAKRLKNELKKQSHANKYYEEMLYASKDGYLTCSYYKNKEYSKLETIEEIEELILQRDRVF